MVALAGLLRADRSFDLPLLMLTGLPEHGQQHDPPIRSTPVRYPRRNIGKPDPQFPDLPFQMIRPRAAKLRLSLGKQPAHLIHALVVAVAEVVQPVQDLRLQLEAIKLLCPIRHRTGA